MCASCRGGCGLCIGRCRCTGCCGPMPDANCRPYLEKLQPVSKYRWFRHCTTAGCKKCQRDDDDDDGDDDNGLDCDCICRRNRHIIEALSCLFSCSIQYMVSILFKLAYLQQQPLKRFPRDRVWDVMEHVKAPYTELNDLDIYDSMYDRCGLPIDPLDTDNMLKIVRLMFLTSVLTIDQEDYLLNMLQRLNAKANCPVHLDLLLQTLEGVDLKKLVCSMRDQEALTRGLYTSRLCNSICKLYRKVATVDKHLVRHNRNRRRNNYNNKPAASSEHAEEVPPTRQSVLNRQFCDRKPPAQNEANTSPKNSTNKTMSNRFSNPATRGMRYSGTTNSRRYYSSSMTK
ncbi:uncharacterized protein LOC115769103 [Drosophila novamexicana]|uniref:uncharacterized protein LOC115769103 n=1 Tax=Drosophila novamexicana TaxID=47314 RepID=UPI0011E58946|nr:uncharacterized protein LOC115769103 [Drosophila novamexicana]